MQNGATPRPATTTSPRSGGRARDQRTARPSREVASRPARVSGSPPEAAHPALRRALDAIDGRLGEKITLQDIADAACMSRFHFARLFRLGTGCSPMQYLLRSRLEQAQRLLREGTLPICEVAAATGFADQSHLTRQLRRAIGMTPRQYARRHASRMPVATASRG